MERKLRRRETAAPFDICAAIHPRHSSSLLSSLTMSNLSLPSDTDSEGKPPGWRHWWDRVATPSSSGSPPMDIEEDWEANEEEEEETEEAAVAKKEARARAKAEAKAKTQPASTDDDEGDTSSSDASNNTGSSEVVTSRRRHREDDEAGLSKKKYFKILVHFFEVFICN
jgi:hypothetical protein